ncbi:MAG: phosphoribosyl-ATP diphosphatase, partial [Planctomycetota bacterium]
LRSVAGGFLVTFVEREGRLVGLPADRVRSVVEAAGGSRVTVAGGVRTPGDIALADEARADAQVGMALYKGEFDLADALAACLKSDRADGLWPTVVCDEHGRALGLAYSNLESLRVAIESGRGAYHSRSRGGLWEKGKTSGDTQDLLGVSVDCDRDALRFTVRQHGGGFCHLGTATCFGPATGIAALNATIRARLADAPAGSYTRRLLDDPSLLEAKLREEAGELIAADAPSDAAWEAADVMYFAMVAALARGASLADIERHLDRRTLKVTRRPGNAKPGGPTP